MFTVELKINGIMIGHIYGRNVGESTDGRCYYEYEYYEPERPALHHGEVIHKRDDGITKLIQAILEDIPDKKQ